MIEFLFNNFAQFIGFIAILLVVISFQINNRSKILGIQIISGSLWAVHFFLIEAFTGSAMNLIGVARNYTFVKYRNRFRKSWILFIFLGIFGFAAAITWDGYESLLPLGGMASGTIAFWQKNTTLIRLIGLLAPPLWFTYNFINMSYAGMLAEIFIFSSIIVAIIRYDVLKKPEPSLVKDRLSINE